MANSDRLLLKLETVILFLVHFKICFAALAWVWVKVHVPISFRGI